MENECLSMHDLKCGIEKHYDIKINKIEKINHSFTDCYILYGNEKYFAKVFSKIQDIAKITQEKELLTVLKKEGFNVPNILKAKDERIYFKLCGHYIFLERFIEGLSYAESPMTEEELLKSARLLGKLHKTLNHKYDDVNKEDYWQNLNLDKDNLNDLLSSFHNVEDTHNELIIKTLNHKIRMLPNLKKMNEEFVGITYLMTHGDYSKRNLIKDAKDNIYIIDFSDAGVYPASWELIRSYFISTDSCKDGIPFNYALFSKYVKAYLQEFSLNVQDFKLMPYLLLYQILTSNYRYQEYLETKDDKYLKFMEWKENTSIFLEENASKLSELFLTDVEKES